MRFSVCTPARDREDHGSCVRVWWGVRPGRFPPIYILSLMDVDLPALEA